MILEANFITMATVWFRTFLLPHNMRSASHGEKEQVSQRESLRMRNYCSSNLQIYECTDSPNILPLNTADLGIKFPTFQLMNRERHLQTLELVYLME